MANILDTRLVCGVFDREVIHSLHQHIRLAQMPHLALMRTLIRQSYVDEQGPTLHTSLLATALFHSASTASPRRRPLAHETPRIAQRLRNCVAMAARIDPAFSRTELLRRMSTAASSSIYIQEYIYMPSYYQQLFQTTAEGDACLEVALLMVCGFGREQVVKSMVGLVKDGQMRPYAQGKYEWEVKRERRWGNGGRVRKYGRSDLSFLGGRAMLW
ncbi:hypothetical protein ACEQ8H_003873 [Pleosporales sp. CAS-2024a]